MRAAVYRGPHQLVCAELPAPLPADSEVLLDVIAAGICGTDVRIYKGEHRAAQPGRVPGHEIVGRVVAAAGTLPDGLSAGDIVFVAPNLGCGACRWCGRGQENLCPQTGALGITLDGGFAEQVAVPARAVARGNLIRLAGADAAGETWAHAVLAEPLACVLRGQAKVGIEPGDSVLVSGGGPVGLLHVALAKARGAGLVVCSEPSPIRRDAALRAGATQVIDPTAASVTEVVADLTAGAGVDVVITAAPVHALQAQALELAATGGRVLYFGGLPKSRPSVELDTNHLHYKELTLVGTTASNVEDCRRAVDLITTGVVDTTWMVSHRFDLTDVAAAIRLAQDPAALKVQVSGVLPPIGDSTEGGKTR